ncbi:MAG: hypothetical protein VYE40_04705 [Myxococcota bacterium]|nr:hypothetical protein [Myxococcota bacterium]MEC9440389.1 hypothetical protein [Myxococcota bacterium]
MATQPQEDALGEEEAKDLEVLRRVLFSLMLPTTRVASTQEFPLKELTTLLRLAYFRQLRGRGKTLREISDTLDVSVRTAKRLSQRLKENFFLPELEHELPRRIEFMLWAAPMSLARLNQVIEDADLDEIDAALEQLLDEERAVEVEDRPGFYMAPRVETRLVKDSMVSRIGALNSFLGNITNAIHGRFFNADPTSFVRTLSFRIAPEQLTELRALYEQLYEQLREMEQTSRSEQDEEELLEMQLSLCWAPYEREEEVEES